MRVGAGCAAEGAGGVRKWKDPVPSHNTGSSYTTHTICPQRTEAQGGTWVGASLRERREHIQSVPSGIWEFKGRGEKYWSPDSSCHEYQLSI